jgi:hypothetical protein
VKPGRSGPALRKKVPSRRWPSSRCSSNGAQPVERVTRSPRSLPRES